MVAAELRSDEHAEGVMLLVIRNYGPTVARALRVTFEPPIPPDDDLPPQTMGHLIRMRYATEIPVLTPGMELDNIWYVAGAGQREVNEEGLADRFSVRVEYVGPDDEPWDDVFELDVDLLRKRSYVTSSNDPRQQFKAAIKALERTASALESEQRRKRPAGS